MNPITKYFKEDLLRLRPDFEVRAGQLDMSLEVAKYLDSKDNYFIEAGTGVGKSLAYLIPAAHYALKNKEKVIVATYSKVLQNQLLEKDLPLVQELFKSKGPLKVSMIKGRVNYICLRRLKNALDTIISSKHNNQLKFWDKNPQKKEQLLLIKEYSERGIGERDYIDCQTDLVWDDICSQRFSCLKFRCPWKKKCFLNVARNEQNNSHIIIVNHALFFADLVLKSSGNSLLPDYKKVIFDEAHHLEDVIADSYAIEMNIYKIRSFSQLIMNPFSLFGQAVRLDENAYSEISQMKKELDSKAELFFEKLNCFLTNSSHITYQAKQIQDNGLLGSFKALINYLEAPELADILQLTDEAEGDVENVIAAGKQLLEEIKFLIEAGSNDYVYWIERDDLGNIAVKACPINPGEILQLDLFSEVNALFTSATLAAKGSFSYIAQRLGVNKYSSKICSSPFNYKKQCLVLIPKRGLNPKSPDYNEYIIQCCRHILPQTRGRAFILFTSYSSLNYCYDKLYDWMLDEGLEPMAQGRGISPFRLIENYKKKNKPVLFGTNSFWEGMDVPGEKLSCVIVTKLPFVVPSHPVEAARMQRIKSQGQNDFIEYSIPKAVIKFKQGFGRLIRTSHDKGIVAVLDVRIKQYSYGKYFLESLPDVALSNNLTDIGDFLNPVSVV
jgi:ATP-dependent DNA helicase DinG